MWRSQAALEYAFTLAIALLIAAIVAAIVIHIAQKGAELVKEEADVLIKEIGNLTQMG